MQAIEQVFVGFGTIVAFLAGIVVGRIIGVKKGQALRSTDSFIYKNYPLLKDWKIKKMPEAEIVANLLKYGTEKQAQELLKFYDKYQKKRDAEEAKHFKEQFKDEPIGKKIVDSLPFKY